MRAILFVLGMHRSGTSALSRVLSLCGASLPPNLVPASTDNPTGFWEPRRAVELNGAFLASQQSSMFDPSLSLQIGAASEKSRGDFVDAICSYLRGLDAKRLLVVKDPRISVLFPYWSSAAKECGYEVKVVLVFRNPYEVAMSLFARERMATGQALALWANYNLVAERDSRPFSRVFVSYEELLTDWKGLVSRCATQLGLPLASTPRASTAVADFLTPDLRHHALGASVVVKYPIAEERARRIYALLADATADRINVPAFDSELATLVANGPLLAEESTRDSVRAEHDLTTATRRAVQVAAVLERRLASLERDFQ
jgi:hypothetical protein